MGGGTAVPMFFFIKFFSRIRRNLFLSFYTVKKINAFTEMTDTYKIVFGIYLSIYVSIYISINNVYDVIECKDCYHFLSNCYVYITGIIKQMGTKGG